MRHLRRILLDALTVLSLLLALASALLWMRSYWRRDDLGWRQPARPGAESLHFNLGSGGGGVSALLQVNSPGVVSVADGRYWYSYEETPIPYAGGYVPHRRGFGYESLRHPYGRWVYVVFPTWLAVALFASLPLTRFAMSIRRRRRVREACCTNCGYDLRATPGRCPECGTARAA